MCGPQLDDLWRGRWLTVCRGFEQRGLRWWHLLLPAGVCAGTQPLNTRRPIKLGVQHKPAHVSFRPTGLPQVCQECAWMLALLRSLYVCMHVFMYVCM